MHMSWCLSRNNVNGTYGWQSDPRGILTPAFLIPMASWKAVKFLSWWIKSRDFTSEELRAVQFLSSTMQECCPFTELQWFVESYCFNKQTISTVAHRDPFSIPVTFLSHILWSWHFQLTYNVSLHGINIFTTGSAAVFTPRVLRYLNKDYMGFFYYTLVF